MLNDSSIIIRVRQFLSGIPPFCFLDDEGLHLIATYSKVSVLKAGDYVFESGNEAGEFFFVVKKGAVAIRESTAENHALFDKCGEGDMFGIRPILARSPYAFDAVCSEDAILYDIPIDKFKAFYIKFPKAVEYMVQRFAAGHSTRETQPQAMRSKPVLLSNLLIKPLARKHLVSIPSGASVHQAIKRMSEHGVSSIIVEGMNKNPIGILTDRDIRNLVASKYDPNDEVDHVMSCPVKCVSAEMPLPELQLVMIESGLHHLCITQDGTADSQGVGMVTEHDILYASATDPIVLIKKIKSATDISLLIDCREKIDQLLPTFLEDDINQALTLTLIDRLNRTLIKRTVHLCLKQYNASHSPISEDSFSFYSMGSTARGEQLLMTDQDNGIIIADESVSPLSEYLELGRLICDTLNTIGYVYCPAEMMASNADWCTTLSAMKSKVEQWILSPGPEEVLKTAIFFDFRHEFGQQTLTEQLTSYIKSLLKQQDQYIRFLAKNAVVNPPPLSFFRKFIIEKDGEHKDQFDIKKRGIAPLTNCARAMALDAPWLNSSSTIERYEELKSIDPGNAHLYDEAQESFLFLLTLRLRFALKNNDSGRYINPEQLEKIDRIQLRRCFSPARRIIDMMDRKYRLSYL